MIKILLKYDTMDKQKGSAHDGNNSKKWRNCRGFGLFARRSTGDSYASKGYCQRAGYQACRIIKTKSIKHFKCLKKVHEWYHKGKKSSECMSLPEKFEKNPQMIECIFFQDEIDFLLQISINRRIVFTLRDKSEMFLIKVVLLKQIDNLLQLLWHGTLWRNYHWSIKRTKLNTENYRNNLKKELYPAMSEIYQQNFYFHPRWNPFTYTRSCLRCFEGRKPYHASYSKKINCPRNHQIAAKWKQMWMKIA